MRSGWASKRRRSARPSTAARRPGSSVRVTPPSSLNVARNGCAGIDADDAEFAREEFQFLQRKGEALVVGMAVDVGIELRGEEIAVDHVAFELGHVDAVGGEAAHRLVERGGQVAHPENKSGDQRPRALLGPVRLARQHHEARGVVGLVLDVLGQDIEAVDFGGQPRGDRGAALVAALGDDARALPAVSAGDDRLDAELADDAAALAERVDVALDGLDVGELGAARRHQLMVDRQEPFADDEQAGCGSR